MINSNLGGKLIHVKRIGECPMGWPAYKGIDIAHRNFYYIQQPDSCKKLSWYRCSKDWEPQYKCRPELFLIDKLNKETL
jgi:hypothetical protein